MLSSSYTFFNLYAFILLTSTLVPGKQIFKLYAFILLTSTLVPGINYFVVTTYNSSSSSVTGSEEE